MSSIINKEWELIKTVLPQHTDHAGVMWHGSYLNWMEEGRVDALREVGLPYEELSSNGYEMPVVSMEIKYKLALNHGEEITLKTWFLPSEGIKLPCKVNFEKTGGIVAAESMVNLVVVSNKTGKNRLVRSFPNNIKESIYCLQKGPHPKKNASYLGN